MKLVVLGLSLSSSWGNGHATTYRALLSGMAERGHEVLFLERSKPWYADHRDLADPDFCRLEYYDSVGELERWRAEVSGADAVMVGSYVPDGPTVGDWVLHHARGATCFYDIDTPVTLAQLERGRCEFLRLDQIARYDVYFSFTGGPVLDRIEHDFGAQRARPLHCSADVARYRKVNVPRRWDLSYLGTYSADRQPTLERLLLETARMRPDRRFAVAGAQYPSSIDWPDNVERLEHVAPRDHPAFYSASRFTLNVTRADMIAAGWSPSIRLFEAGACSTAVISDRWPGIEDILPPGQAILLADSANDVLAALDADPEPLGRAAHVRIVQEHSGTARARQLERDLRDVAYHAQQRQSERLIAQ